MNISGKPFFQAVSSTGMRLILSLMLLTGFLATAAPVMAKPAAMVPTFSIVNVSSDSTVTIQTANFPPNEKFTIRMGEYGTLGINGVVVATTESGGGGIYQATYTIPDSLKGKPMIAIRMDNDNGYFYSYNWFYNYTAPAATPVPGSTPVPPYCYGTQYCGCNPTYCGIPTFTISSVSRDNTVVIRSSNFPPNETFTVRMGYYGTYGLNGVVVATTESGTGGAFEATFTIPDSLKGQEKIAIRMDNSTGYYFSYNWFWNNTTSQ
ncbi:MAG: hypothetical protein LWX83_04220 [Anaerolineae bacterium]|nr:hypothetical protein [Anaerolineae bacterium]